jgi:hypothetical protein
MKKSNYCTNLTFGRILNRHLHFKHTLQAQRCRDCGWWTLPCHMVSISHGSTAISEEKKISLNFYWTCIFTFRISLVVLSTFLTRANFKHNIIQPLQLDKMSVQHFHYIINNGTLLWHHYKHLFVVKC